MDGWMDGWIKVSKELNISPLILVIPRRNGYTPT